MDYNFSDDIKAIRDILGMTQDELAAKLGVERVTISRNELGIVQPSSKLLEEVYSFAFDHDIRINELKSMFYKDGLKGEHVLLYHGSKTNIDGKLSINKGKKTNDFGQGFYAGETYMQAISYVSGFDESSLYMLDFNNVGLKHKKYIVDTDWMLIIAYHRGGLGDYENSPRIKKLINELDSLDYVIAPIADNRMFQLIDSFVEGSITDEQCVHCLSATNLGYQYVFTSEKALKSIALLEKCYLSKNEKDYYKQLRLSDLQMGDDKVKLARIKYRNKGKYIDEML